MKIYEKYEYRKYIFIQNLKKHMRDIYINKANILGYKG